MSKKLIVANWKMSPDTIAEAQGILESANDVLSSESGEVDFSLVFCPPFVFLEEVGGFLGMSSLSQVAVLGAQDIAPDEDSKALTGEVSGSMLQRLDVRYVIVGHSERRWKLGESDETVREKIGIALESGLTPIVCVGERVRDDAFASFLDTQVTRTFHGLSQDEVARCVLAYEPVWAISSTPGARPDNPESMKESLVHIQKALGDRVPRAVLYGGSVTPDTFTSFYTIPEINGVLIGGASVDKEKFAQILKSALHKAESHV